MSKMNLQCRPRTAVIAGNVGKVSNDQAVSVGLIALESDAVAASAVRVVRIGMIDTNVDLVVCNRIQALGFCVSLVKIRHKAICRIRDLFKN